MNSPSDFDLNRQIPQPAYEEEEIDLLHYWVVINRHKWGILGLTGVVLVFSIVVVLSLTPIYLATATLLIESEETKVVSIEELYGIDSSQREYYQTQFEILNSRQLSEKVIDKLGIGNHAEYDPELSQTQSWRRFIPFVPAPEPLQQDRKREAVINRFQENLSIEPIRNTQLVNIKFESSDSDLTYSVANEIGDSYIENHLEARLELTQKAADWLTERLGGMQQKLEASEEALQAYREQEDLVDVSGVETMAVKELNEITERMLEVKNRASELRSQVESVKSSSGGYDESWETLPAVLKDDLVKRLKEDEESANNAFAELKRRYGPKHPKYISADSQFQSARVAYRSRVQKVVSGLEQEYQQALADEVSVTAAQSDARGRAQILNRKRYELGELEREAQTNRQLYDLFFKRFRETNETDFAAANARFVDKAVKPYQPVKPKKALIVSLCVLLSLFLGVLLAFLKEVLDNTIRAPEDVEEKLNQPLLGLLPKERALEQGNINSSTLYLNGEFTLFSEAVRSLRTSLVLSGIDKPHKVIIITSSVPGEGKTTLCSNIVLAMAQMEKVILVDADMRRPSLAEAFDLPPGSDGLAELIAQTSEQEQCIHRLSNYNMDLIPAGTVPPNPLDLLSSSRFEALIDSLSKQYDRVIIDSAPMQLVSDALVLSKYADALIYLIRTDSTPLGIVQNGLKRMHQVNAPVIGVVLNQFDAEAASKRGYGGQYGYYGYGYSSKKYA